MAVYQDVPPQPDSRTDKINKVSNNPKALTTYFKVYVPNVDIGFALPENIINPDPFEQELIRQYYLYEASSNNLGSVPKPGDTVGVLHPLAKGYKNKIGEIRSVIADGGTPFVKTSAKKKTEQANRTKRDKEVPINIPEKSKCEQDPYGDTCAYDMRGKLLGEIETGKIKTPIIKEENKKVMRKDAAAAYERMKQAAKSQGVDLKATSAFRSWKEQEVLRKNWVERKAGANPASKPGNSLHQSGIAVDIQTGTPNPFKGTRFGYDPFKPSLAEYSGASKIYKWLAKNAAEYGFVRTVVSEPWHWVYFGADTAKRRRPKWQ
jgi:LAS superfamily LD-carboxypeptidase LdcB